MEHEQPPQGAVYIFLRVFLSRFVSFCPNLHYTPLTCSSSVCMGLGDRQSRTGHRNCESVLPAELSSGFLLLAMWSIREAGAVSVHILSILSLGRYNITISMYKEAL